MRPQKNHHDGIIIEYDTDESKIMKVIDPLNPKNNVTKRCFQVD